MSNAVNTTYRENLETGLSTLESIQARGENWRGSPCYGRRKVVYAPDISKNQNGEKKFKKLSSKIGGLSVCSTLLKQNKDPAAAG